MSYAQVSSCDGYLVDVKTFHPKGGLNKNLPVILWVHGGGFFLGDHHTDDPLIREMCHDQQCVVVTLNYRLVPEHAYPKPFEDCLSVLRWIRQDAHNLSIDPTRISILGISAGACLAAALALHCRDKGNFKLEHLSLFVPVLDYRHQTASSNAVCDERVWNRGLSLQAWESYLRDVQPETPYYASPALSDDLQGLPPCTITIEGEDMLRDEGLEFAQRLIDANVPTALHVFPGCFHGAFLSVPQASVSKRHKAILKGVITSICTSL